MFDDVVMGDKIKFENQQHQVLAGRVVMNRGTHLVLNVGGRYGRPAIVTEKNFVEHIPARRAH